MRTSPPRWARYWGAGLGTLAFYAAIYFLPTIAGWTGIGWFVYWAYLIVKMMPRGGTAGAWGSSGAGGTYTPPTSQPPSWEPSQQRQRCGSCGGSGKTTCFMCAGQGGRWTQPVTATDTSRWDACGSCTSSGKVTCSSCSASGYGW